MSKKLEQEILFKDNFLIKSANGDEHEGQVRLKRRGLKFYVEKSCLIGTYVLHVDTFDDVELAYQHFVDTVEQYREFLKH